MTAAISMELDQLFTRAKDDSIALDTWALFDLIVRFRHMAPFNAALVYIQKPGCFFAASAEDWEKRFQRHIKPNARPLMILKPFAPVAFVYDYTDTEGADFPEELLKSVSVRQEISTEALDWYRDKLALAGFCYEEQDYGLDMSGRLVYTEHPRLLHIPAAYGRRKAKQVESHFTIVVNQHCTPAEKLAVILHELGHFFCGHLGSSETAGIPERMALSEAQCECEAESAAWLAGQRLGLDIDSEEYINAYIRNGEMPEVSRDCIIRAVGKMEEILK